MVHMCEMFFVLLIRTCFDSKIGICLQGCCISDAARPRPFKALSCAQPPFKGCSNRRKLCWFCRQCSPGAEELVWWALRTMDVAGYIYIYPDMSLFLLDKMEIIVLLLIRQAFTLDQAIDRWNERYWTWSYRHTSTATAASTNCLLIRVRLFKKLDQVSTVSRRKTRVSTDISEYCASLHWLACFTYKS